MGAALSAAMAFVKWTVPLPRGLDGLYTLVLFDHFLTVPSLY